MNRRKLVGLAITLALGFAVVGGVLLNSTELRSNGGGENGPVRLAQIEISPGQVKRSGSNVSMSPEVVIHLYDYGDPPKYDDILYEDVMFCAYDEEGAVLHSTNLGSVSSPETGEFFKAERVNMTVATVPKYLIVDHPALRNDSPFDTKVQVWNADRERYSPALDGGLSEIQDRFEFPRTHEPGICG